MRNKVKLFLLGLACCLSIAAKAEQSNITAIRASTLNGTTHVVFQFSEVQKPRIFSLTKPDRLVLDFENTHLSVNLNKLHFNTSEVSGIRDGYPKSGVLRLVLDTRGAMRYHVLVKPDAKQLVLDVFYKTVATTKIATKVKPVISAASPSQATQTKSRSSATVVSSTRRTMIVVIDPGHGGKDPGAIGEHGTKEKDVVLAIAKNLAKLINQQPDMRAVLTRHNDHYVTLYDRLQTARKDKADLFVAIHADSYFNNHAAGASVYTLSKHGATSLAAKWLAQKENHSELGGVDFGELEDQSYVLRSVLIDLAQTATSKDSLWAGRSLLQSLESVTKLHYTRVEQAPFMVLKSPDIPSILVETGFISNVKEEQRLSNKEHQNKIALALFDGIRAYYKKSF